MALLQKDLTQTMVRVEEKRAATEQLLAEMGVQRADAEVQRATATVEAEKASDGGGWVGESNQPPLPNRPMTLKSHTGQHGVGGGGGAGGAGVR